MGLIFENNLNAFIAIFSIITVITILYIKRIYGYWKRYNIKYIRAQFPLGNFGPSFMQRMSIAELLQNLYNQMDDEPFVGIFSGIRPTLLLRDPNLIRTIFIKDFNHFHDRGVYIDEKNDPLSGHLFSLNGEKWKNLRAKLTPTFTSGKLKSMFPIIIDCGTKLQCYMDKMAMGESICEIREISARFTTDIIASVAFGIDINCIDNPNTEFRHYGRKVFQLNLKNGLRNLMSLLWPELQALLKIKSVDNDVENFMKSVVKSTLDYRENHNIIRKDFFQLLIQLRNTGNVQLDGHWETTIVKDEKNKTLTVDEVAAQAFVFYLAGFETSSTVMSYCLYELSKNIDTIQLRVQNEIDEVLARFNGNISYESVSEMRYLDWCIDETLRMYPPVPFLNRISSNVYTFPGTNTTIAAKTPILIPLYAIHHDEKYFPNPKCFDPERFNPDNCTGKQFTDMPFMPFGDGPRNCIGLRMGKLQTKIGLVYMLQKNTFELGDKNFIMRFSPASVVLTPVDGLPLKVIKRK